MDGKTYRMSRIFRPADGRTLILPVDHGIALGDVAGLGDPLEVVERLAPAGIDGVLLTGGVFRHRPSPVFTGREALARLLTVDAFTAAGEGEALAYGVLSGVETALTDGYDAVKLLLVWDQEPGARMANMEAIARVVEAAAPRGMPVMVEPILATAPADPDLRRRLLADGVRVAYELGADILKVPDPGSPDVLADWAARYPVPLVLLGGGAVQSPQAVARAVAEAIDAGVRGLVMGRNVWQRPPAEARALLEQLAAVVHG